jgi:hypothetical protein
MVAVLQINSRRYGLQHCDPGKDNSTLTPIFLAAKLTDVR